MSITAGFFETLRIAIPIVVILKNHSKKELSLLNKSLKEENSEGYITFDTSLGGAYNKFVLYILPIIFFRCTWSELLRIF